MSWSHYLLQVNIYLIVFYTFYRLLLAKETYFTLNRMYLICSGIFALSIPFIQVDWFSKQEISQHIYVQVEQLNQFIVQAGTQTAEQSFSWNSIFILVYLIGIIFFAVRFVIQLLAVKRILNGLKSGLAFSFWNKKIVAQTLPEAATINHHEDVHIKQFHTFDVIFFELLGIATWFNPIIYLYKETIRNIHEYLADEAAAKFQGDKEAYSMLLLNQAFGVNANALTNGFFKKSMIKKRIFMLYKERSRKTAIVKYGIFVPLFAAALLLSSATISNNKEILAVSKQINIEEINSVVTEVLKPKEKAVEVTMSQPKIKLSASKLKLEDKNATVKRENNNPNTITIAGHKQAEPDDDNILHNFVSIETPPSYPGGMAQFYDFLGKNIKYPEEAYKANIQGNVFVSFIVEKDGSLSDIKIDRKLGYGTDEEAVRVLKLSKKWIPATRHGKPVRVKYNLPIKFALKNKPQGEAKGNLIDNSNELNPEKEGVAFKGIEFNSENHPLIVLDGKIVENETLKTINPKDIESINVLKDLSAIKIYGDKGKNGVIVIKSKISFPALKMENQ